MHRIRFFMSSGSGIFINTGRTIVFGSDKSSEYMRSFLDVAGSTGDDMFCSGASKLGYDTIQLGFGDKSQLLVCTGTCMTEPLSTSCPKVELRTGVNATVHCECNDEIKVLNCGRNIAPAEPCLLNKLPPPPYINASYRKSCIFASHNIPASDPAMIPINLNIKPFNITIAVTVGFHGVGGMIVSSSFDLDCLLLYMRLHICA